MEHKQRVAANKAIHESQHTQSTELTATLTESLRTYTEDPSLSKKEDMRQVLNECQKQISALTSMVEKMEFAAEERLSPDLTKNRKRPPKDNKKRYEEEESSSEFTKSPGSNSASMPQLPFRSSHSRHSTRRTSIRGRANRTRKNRCGVRGRNSIHSYSSSTQGLDESVSGGASIASKSLHSVSQSVKSLPREIELMDEDEDYDNYSFYDEDVRSIESRSALSQSSRRSQRSKRSLRRNSVRPSEDEFSHSSTRDSASVGSSRSQTSRRSRGRRRGGDVLRQTSFNASTDTIQVENQELADPYGERGVYSGALSKSTGMPNGRGLLEYHENSRWCEGDWIHGRLTGYGRLSNGAGDFYEGGLKNDHFHGKGVMRFDNGRVFEGTYIRGQMVQGKMTYQDGSVYDGSWLDCARHGHGTCTFVDGSVYEGEFRAGHFHGRGQMTWNDGGYYLGNWSFGEMHGNGKEIRPNGSIRHAGEWSHDQPVRDKKNNKDSSQKKEATVKDESSSSEEEK